MEEYTNRELGLILSEMRDDLKDIKTVIFGNGKPGILQRLQGLETWKAMIVGGFSIISLLIVPLAIKVIADWIGKK